MTRSLLLPVAMLMAAAFTFGSITSPACAALITYTSNLGPEPSVVSSGTGFTQVDYDDVLHTLRVQVNFSGLTGITTASHIHAPTAVALTGNAGVATQTPTFSGFPSGVTSGTYDNTFDLTLAASYNASYITANGGTPASAEAALAASIAAGKSYLNIHSSAFPAGEIRGYLQPVPEPSTLVLLGIGLAGLAVSRRKSMI